MKKLLLSAILIVISVSFSFAQKQLKVVISTPTVQCEMCKKKIENFLSREEGVTSVKVDYKRKNTIVSYFGDRINVEQLKASIANLGYQADDVTAEEDAYKRLPKCCKVPVTDK